MDLVAQNTEFRVNEYWRQLHTPGCRQQLETTNQKLLNAKRMEVHFNYNIQFNSVNSLHKVQIW